MSFMKEATNISLLPDKNTAFSSPQNMIWICDPFLSDPSLGCKKYKGPLSKAEELRTSLLGDDDSYISQ